MWDLFLAESSLHGLLVLPSDTLLGLPILGSVFLTETLWLVKYSGDNRAESVPDAGWVLVRVSTNLRFLRVRLVSRYFLTWITKKFVGWSAIRTFGGQLKLQVNSRNVVVLQAYQVFNEGLYGVGIPWWFPRMAGDRALIVPDSYFYFCLGEFNVLLCYLVRVAFRVEAKNADSYRILLNSSFEINRDIFSSVFKR